MISNFISIQDAGINLNGIFICLHDSLKNILKTNQDQMAMIDQRLGFNDYELDIELDGVEKIEITFFQEKLDFIDITTHYESSKELNNWLNTEIGKERVFDWGEIKTYKSDYSAKHVILIKRLG